MHLSTFMQGLIRGPDEVSPCSSLIVQHSSISGLPYRSFKQRPESEPSTPSTCNVDDGERQDPETIFSLDLPFLPLSFLFAVDGHVDWVDQAFSNISHLLEPVNVAEVKFILNGPDSAPQRAPLEEPPSFSEFLSAFFLLVLFIQQLGNGSYPPSSPPFGAKRTTSFDNDQGSNKKPRQDQNNYNYNNPGDNGDDPGDDDDDHNNSDDNDEDKTPKGKGAAKGKEKDDGIRICCMFHKLNPIQYEACGHLKITSFAYLLQHFTRQHLLQGQFYCKNCRRGWSPKAKSSERLWTEHTRAGKCKKATLEETGKLLPHEYDEIKSKTRSVATDTEKWFKTWGMLFCDHEEPDSPFLANIGKETEASDFRRMNRSLAEELALLPPSRQREMEAFARRVIDRAFPAYAGRSSAAGPSTPAGPSMSRNAPGHTPQATGWPGAGRGIATPRATAPAPRTRSPPLRPAPNQGLLPDAFINPGLIMDTQRNPAFSGIYTGLLMNHAMSNTIDPRCLSYPPANPARMRNTADPGPSSVPGPPGPSPSNPNANHHQNINSFQANNTATAGFDQEAFESGVNRAYNDYFPSQDSTDSNNYPPWRRI